MDDKASMGKPEDERNASETYLALRNQILGYAERSSDGVPEYQAVIMDWPLARGIPTIVAAFDGTASIYLSSGGGFIGGGQKYLTLRNAALATLDCAREVEPLMSVADHFPLPSMGEIRFYLVKRGQVLTATAQESDLRENRSEFAKLASAAMQIMTQYRVIESSKRKPAVQ